MKLLPILSLAILLFSTSARAQQPPPPQTGDAAPTGQWYGWQIIAIDGAVAATWVAADLAGSKNLSRVGLAGYVFGAAITHAIHDRRLKAGSSVGLRLLAPIVGGLFGSVVARDGCADSMENVGIGDFSSCEGRGIVVGALVAMIGVSIFDIARAYSPGGPEWHPDRGLALAPLIAPTRTGASVGLVGHF